MCFLYGAAANFGARAEQTHTHTTEAIESCSNCCANLCYYKTSGLYLLKMWHRNEEAGEQKGNTWRYFSGCLKTCEGT